MLNLLQQPRVYIPIRHLRPHHLVITFNNLPVRADERAARRLRMVVANMEEDQLVVGYLRDFHHALVHCRKSLGVLGMHPSPRVEGTAASAERDGGFAGNLLLA